MQSFGTTNYIVLAVYLAGMVLIGTRLAGRQRSREDFFLAGRRLPWLAVAMSMYASVTSAVTFMGLPKLAYQQNLSLILVGLISPLVAPVLIFLFYPFYRGLGVTTSYEYIARRFGPNARRAVAVLFILARAGWLGTVVYAPALALNVATGIPLTVSIFLMGGVATVYTVMGGLSAVIWTDVAQFVIMVGGAAWLLLSIPAGLPGGWGDLWRHAHETGAFRALGDWTPDLAVMNAFAVALCYSFSLMHDYGVDQVTVQRLLAVRTNRGVARAIVFNAGTDFLMIGLLLSIGIGIHAFYAAHPAALPAGAAGEKVMPHFILHALPDGVSGLLITAIFAAAMSSMDSGINSIATVIENDLLAPLRRAPAPEAAILRRVRWNTVLLGVLTTGVAFVIPRIGGIVEAFFTFTGYFSAPVLALFLLGMLTRRATFAGWLAAAPLSMLAVFLAERRWAVDPVYFFPLCFLLCFGLGIVISSYLRANAGPPEPGLTVWDRKRAAQDGVRAVVNEP